MKRRLNGFCAVWAQRLNQFVYNGDGVDFSPRPRTRLGVGGRKKSGNCTQIGGQTNLPSEDGKQIFMVASNVA